MSFKNQVYEKVSFTKKILASILSNTAMGLGFDLIIQNEITGVGSQWDNIWDTPSPEEDLTVGAMMMMLLIDAVLYMLIALYIEAVFPGEYGVPQPWYFLCSASFWRGETSYAGRCFHPYLARYLDEFESFRCGKFV